MKWALLLHIYQPIQQSPQMLAAIVEQSYRPLFLGIKRSPQARVTLNITGALLELFDRNGHLDLIDLLRELGAERKVEFTGSAKYHALLPFLDESEIKRQIAENTKTCKFFLGDAYKPRGFFPPEMAYTKNLPAILEEEGFLWCVLDEIALPGRAKDVNYHTRYKFTGRNLSVFFRERRISNLVMSAVVRSASSLAKAMQEELSSDRHIITAMDGETFGHHRPGLEHLLFEIFDDPLFHLVTMSELLDDSYSVVEVDPIESTWASSPLDIEEGIQFISWSDPSNDIHFLQKEFVALALRLVRALPQDMKGRDVLRGRMDEALASDHFFWASAKPWWSVEMIEDGAYRLLEIVRDIPGVSESELSTAARLYERIVSTAFEWQRSGKIRELYEKQHAVTRIPFYDRTVGAGGDMTVEYAAFMELFKKEELKAVDRGEYEQAILWRDAMYKLEHKQDIYDAVNVIDLLRTKISNEEVDRMIAAHKEQYRLLRGGQPEQRSN
ncbi:MAG: hypothetical protein AAB869_01470 [Patescibacteria group bacterium]